MTTCCFKSLVKSGSACLRVVFLLFTLSAMESLQLTALMGARPATLEELQSRISELKLNGNLRWGNINHFIQLSSWRTCGVWTKRTTRLQWNVAEPALIWPYLVLGLLGKQILIWAVSRNVEGMSSLWRKSGGSLVWLLVWPEYWTRSCLTESIWAAGGIFLLHWWMISVWISTLFGFSWTELIQMSVHTHRWQMTWDALCTTHRLFSFISLKEDFTY